MRGSYSTPDVSASTYQLGAREGSRFTFRWAAYGERRTVTIDSADFATPVIAAELAESWLQVLTEFGRHESALTRGLVELLRSIEKLPLTADNKLRFALHDLRRAHLDLWELNLLAKHREVKTDTAYRKVLYVFALLRRYEDDHPGTLHEEIVDRLVRQPRLWHHRNEGLPPLSKEEMRQWRRWAYLKIKNALTQTDCGLDDVDVQIATHVLLSLTTGEPPEVLRAVTVDDIEATASAGMEDSSTMLSASERLAHLAKNDLIEQLRVRYRKNRAHEAYDEIYSRRDSAPFKVFRWALMLNAAARAESGNPSLILMRTVGGVVKQPPWERRAYRLKVIAQRNGLAFSGPNYWARLRKTVTSRESLANPRAYLSSGRRHSARTFFGHYTNSTILRAEAGRILIEGVNGIFDKAVHGPTVVTPEAEQALRPGANAPGVDPATARALVAGQLDGPHAGCRDPLNSPYAQEGTICTKSITGTCFACPNALITSHHLPAALAIQDVAHPDRAADIETWHTHWQHIYETLTQIILPAFTSEQIQEARQRAHLTPLDVAVLNDMRGIREDPAS